MGRYATVGRDPRESRVARRAEIWGWEWVGVDMTQLMTPTSGNAATTHGQSATSASTGVLPPGTRPAPRSTKGLPYPPPFTYTDRETKAAYIALKYEALMRTAGVRVLDVGCDRKQLRMHLAQHVEYTGIDLSAEADLQINLDEQSLPFADRSYDVIIAADVLEHLDKVHRVFDDLCRVCRGRLVISLPNPVRNLLLAIAEGKQGKLKHYGLPTQPPSDRHRWFFGAEEAERFLRERGALNGFEVEQIDVEEHGTPAWLNTAGLDLHASANIQKGTTWCLLRRSS